MRLFSALLTSAFLFALLGCSSADQEKAKQEARADVRKASEEAEKAGRELKKDAKELSRKADEATQPGNTQLGDAALSAKVKTKLLSDAGLSTLTNVSVDVTAGVVTLSGTVNTDAQKKASQAAASQVQGVTEVKNRLKVEP